MYFQVGAGEYIYRGFVFFFFFYLPGMEGSEINNPWSRAGGWAGRGDIFLS